MRLFSIKHILFCLQIFICNSLLASDYPVTSYLGIEQGLSNNSVRCIYQDKMGFIWFGTYDGLNRYDGYSFKIFRNNFKNSASLINNWINAIDEDVYGNIWVGTRQGICIYHTLTDNFTPLYYSTSQKHISKIVSVVREIEKDEYGNMFVGTDDIGLIFVPKGDSVGYKVQLENDLSPNIPADISAIKKGTGNKMWVFVRQKGLCVFDYMQKKLKLVNSTLLASNCLEAYSNFLWVGTNNGIYRFNINSNFYEKIYNKANGLANLDIVGLTLDASKKLWCATNGGGVSILNINNENITHLTAGKERHSLTSNSVYAILQDKDARIWIGSLRGGINIIDTHKQLFQTVISDPASSNTLVSNYILSFYEEPNGNIWVGTDGDGLSIWDRKTNWFTNYKHNPLDPGSLSDDFITDIKSDDQNSIWVISYHGGINLFNKSIGKFEHYPFSYSGKNQAILNPLPYSLLEDKNKNLWVGTLQGGLFKWNHANVFEAFDERLKNLLVLASDNSNYLWAGNLSQLVQIDTVNKNHRFYSIGKPVRSILEDKKGNFWIGTEGGGLILFDRKHGKIISRYTTDEGLCSNSVLNILEDNNGDLWISTFNGISKLKVQSRKFTNYYQSDGLQSNQFNYNAALKLKSGELLFGGIKGFTIFNPASISSDTTLPKVLFTCIKVNNTPIEQDPSLIAKSLGNEIQVVRIPFSKAVLSVDFAALDFSAPDKIQYAYYLDGWDRGWNFIGKIRTATYTHLSEGTYLLRVKCTNAAGTWSNRELRLTIVILPPWYRSWWAYLLYFIFVIGLLYSYWKYRTKQTRLKYEVKIANLNAENERAEKQRSLSELEKERIEREKREAELALEKAEKEKGLAELAVEKAELEKERAQRGLEQAEREKERILNEQEREINERKISFFTNISHEFRTPLTLIINPIKDLLKKNGEDKTKTDRELEIVYRNARRMLSLVDQLLLFRRAESGLDNIKPSKLNLHNMAWEVYLCFIQQAKLKNITYSFKSENQNLEIYADREKLEIILYNLLSNALKYTPDNGKISFTIKEFTEEVVVEVQDTGSGIPKEIGDHLFDKFYKAERSITTSKAGFGIGLFLVKHFTEQHKGSISYNSQEGHGATFTLSLLKGKQHFGDQTRISEQESGPVFLELLKEDTVMEEEAINSKLPNTEIVTEKQSILIVDDDEQIRMYLVQLFKENYIIVEAENGENGLKAAQKYLPDLIISDVHMQKMNGIELCQNIKENDSLNHIPVILLTASTSDELKLKGIEQGADDYVTKPFDNDILIARVTNLLKRRNNLQKYFFNEITLNKDNQRISPEYKEFLEKCIAIVEKHLDTDDFNVKTLQKEMGMSHSNLYRRVKSVSGQPINIFIRFIRLRKAAEMFINTNQNVNETAIMVGINDIRYFREQFHKLFGMNPSDYIKKYRRVHGKQFSVDRNTINPEKW